MKIKHIWLLTAFLSLLVIVWTATATLQKKPVVVAPVAPVATTQPVAPRSHVDLAELADITNAERLAAGVGMLTTNPLLNQAAEAHCAELVRGNYFSHTTPEGVKAYTWRAAVGYPYNYGSENLLWNGSAGFSATDVAKQFYRSTEHREAILDPLVTDVGYAVCQPKSYPNMVVEEFVQL